MRRNDEGHKRSIGEARRNAHGNICRRGALGNIFDAAIRQRDVNLLHARLHLEEETSSLSAASCGVKAVPAVVTGQFPVNSLKGSFEGGLAVLATIESQRLPTPV